MTTSDAKEEQEARTRAGGDVETRGASREPAGAAGAGATTRAGGDVETRGVTTAPDDDSEEG